MNPALKSFEHYPYVHRLPMKMGLYTLVELLGQGGMGAVYRGYREGGHGRRIDVAIKVVRDSVLLAADASLLESFSREVEVALGLAHSNVLQVQDFGDHHGIPYVVTDLLRGESADMLIATGRLTPGQSIRLLQGLVRGLAYMHARQPPLVHRDVKPSNVFVTEQGDVKVVDYGLSKAVSDSSQSASATHGTTPYMSPERYLGRVTPAADVFAVGAVIYELMTGKRLFDGSELDPDSGRVSDPSPMIVMRQVEHVEQHLLKRGAVTAVDDVVQGLGAVMFKCLRKEPADRYQDCGELEDALDPFDRRLGASLRGVARVLGNRKAAMAKDETESPRHGVTQAPRGGGRAPIPPPDELGAKVGERSRSRKSWYVAGGTVVVLSAVVAVLAASPDAEQVSPRPDDTPIVRSEPAPIPPTVTVAEPSTTPAGAIAGDSAKIVGRAATPLPPICSKLIETHKACFAEAGDALKAAADGLAEVEKGWTATASAGGGVLLEAECQRAFDTGAKHLSIVCPNVKWDGAANATTPLPSSTSAHDHPAFEVGTRVRVWPPGFVPDGMGQAGIDKLERALRELHFPFYVALYEALPAGPGDEDVRAQALTDGLAQKWGGQGYEIGTSSLFALTFSPRKFSLLAGTRWNAELGLRNQALDPFIERFLARARGTPSDPVNGIIDMAKALDQQVFDAVKPTPAPGFVLVPAGKFTMGSPTAEREFDDETQHEVTLTRAFYLQSTEVTQGQWTALMKSLPAFFGECGKDCPVERTSWFDALAYLNALSKKEGLEPCYDMVDCTGTAGGGCKPDQLHCEGDFTCQRVELPKGLDCEGYRLPTEAEWEYAARAGTTTARYAAELAPIAWYDNNSGSKTHPVGEKQANPLGLYDVLGNVYEWTWDRYQESLGEAPVQDPVGPNKGDVRVLRGGGWSSGARLVRVAGRLRYGPALRDGNVGFRAARSAPRSSNP